MGNDLLQAHLIHGHHTEVETVKASFQQYGAFTAKESNLFTECLGLKGPCPLVIRFVTIRIFFGGAASKVMSMTLIHVFWMNLKPMYSKLLPACSVSEHDLSCMQHAGDYF
jgi:hypothetical protein